MYDECKAYTWVEITLCKDKLYVACCYIPHRESNYTYFYELDCNDPFSDVCVDILTYEKIGKVLVLGDFNARVGTYQNVEVNNVIVSDLTYI